MKIDYEFKNEDQHLDLFIKLLPHDPFSRYFVTEAQFDLREIKFYTQVSAMCFTKASLAISCCRLVANFFSMLPTCCQLLGYN